MYDTGNTTITGDLDVGTGESSMNVKYDANNFFHLEQYGKTLALLICKQLNPML